MFVMLISSFNRMKPSSHEHQATMDVVYSTTQMAALSVKEAQDIFMHVIPAMPKVDYDKVFFDMVTFDSATLVQTAGWIYTA